MGWSESYLDDDVRADLKRPEAEAVPADDRPLDQPAADGSPDDLSAAPAA